MSDDEVCSPLRSTPASTKSSKSTDFEWLPVNKKRKRRRTFCFNIPDHVQMAKDDGEADDNNDASSSVNSTPARLEATLKDDDGDDNKSSCSSNSLPELQHGKARMEDSPKDLLATPVMSPLKRKSEAGNSQVRSGNDCVDEPPAKRRTSVAQDSNNFDTDKRKENARSRDLCNFPWFSNNEISNECQKLFENETISMLPSGSARIFAHISLTMNHSFDDDELAISPSFLGESWSSRFIPLIRSFINAEIEATMYNNYSIEHEPKEPVIHIDKKRKVQFSAFDYSSVWSPVDCTIGSNAYLEKCILALQTAFDRIDDICSPPIGTLQVEPSLVKRFIVKKIITCFERFRQESNQKLREELSKAMPPSLFWPPARFCEVAKQYELEFKDMLDRLSQHYCEKNDSNGLRLPCSPLRKRLGDLNIRAVRFHLRRLFNSIPIPYTTPSSEYDPPDLTKTRSNVHKVVQLESNSYMGIAAADGSISSVFSLALRKIYDFYLLNNVQMSSGTESRTFMKSFCKSAASEKQFSRYDPILSISNKELDDILSDVKEVLITVTGGKASDFVCQLLEWPGVVDAIRDCGGWEHVEKYASNFTKLGMETLCPEDAHFSQLKDVSSFLSVLKRDLDLIKESALIAEERSKVVWKNLRCGSTNKRMLRKNPAVVVIRDSIKEGRSIKFPDLIVPPEDDEE
eukprot:CAMPEP_0172486692 /NCGR_PEP_ID=MMETSP1066-20121228/15364_1 /TAXON_ID=671091 /ORGANISM="Coscinodiscus wailesii, Strain CCMP2513" /LENGTH=686 /DNA_ID=CAMNT_0013252797 /DNA_START=375 /DNA_END=2435 /DNA_ORIENTATION=-